MALLRAEYAWSSGHGISSKDRVEAEEEPSDAEEELGIPGMLREYGLIALLFHFTVWISCLATVYAVLTFAVDINNLPDWLSFLEERVADGAEGEVGAAAGFAGRAAATLGLVEAVGPARLALTLTATPRVSAYARKIPLVRDAEEWLETSVARFQGQDRSE